MRRFALLLLLCPPAASAQTAKPEDSSTIEGRVLNAATGAPLAKASLLLMRIGSTPDSGDYMRSYAASSDSAGKFAIPNIDPGKYRLRASRNGFVTLEYGARASQHSGTLLDLDHPQQLNDVDLRLPPQGVISGRILDADGEPMAGARVQLLRSRYAGGKKGISTESTAYTNDLGEYRWPGLAPGKYYIYAENVESLPPASAPKEAYVPAYYPDATDTTGAVPLDIAAGADVHVGDMVLRKAATATVKGRVVVQLLDAQGSPSVSFSPQAGHNNSTAGTFRSLPAKVNAAGEFEIHSLTPGSYAVVAEISKGGLAYAGMATVNVVAGTNIEGLVVTIGNGASMTGRIRIDGETKPDLRNPCIRLQRGGPTVDSVVFGSTDRIAADGSFRIENLAPDRYAILIEGLPDGFYTKSIRVGGADVTYSGVDLTSGAPGEVEILVSPKAGLVSGVARDPNNSQPVPGATVVLVPKEKERLTISSFYQQTVTDQYGRFTFKNVVPGEYKTYAWDDVEPGSWMDPDFMKPLEEKGESVTVAESSQASVQVNLIPDSETEKPK